MTGNGHMAMREKLDFFGLAEASPDSFADIERVLTSHASGILKDFYGKVAATPRAARHFSSAEMMSRASVKQAQHWNSLFSGRFDDDYHARSRAIGMAHARIGLDPGLYIGGYAEVLGQMVEAIVASSLIGKLPGARRLARTLAVMVRAALLDMDIALSTYFDAKEEEQGKVIESIGQALTNLASGDLVSPMPPLPDTYTRIIDDYATALETLRTTMGTVAETAESIRIGSSEIAAASSDLAKRTEHQSAGVEETAAAMEQVTHSVSETASSAAKVETAMTEAQEKATDGGRIAREAVEAMSGIEQGSSQIAKIVNVIDGIAFQTNLLALNAGVEAARAGDAGKGFAVVANEVRALAQRSADAARDIKTLISDSSAQVESGVRLVHRTGDALDGIVSQISDISVLITQIAEAAREQATGVQQVNGVVSEIGRSTQQNAAMVEQSTAASRTLAGEADRLAALVQQFRIGTAPEARPARPVAQRRAPATPPTSGNLALADDDWRDF